jgi:hypothetical protein
LLRQQKYGRLRKIIEQHRNRWEFNTVAKKKIAKPKLTKRPTPLQEEHKRAKARKKEAQRIRQTFSDDLLGELEGPSKNEP